MAANQLGFIGLGNMGGRIARRLRDAGFDVLGYDVDPGRAAQCGLDTAESVVDAARFSDVLLLSLPDSTVIEQVVRGPDGVLATGRPGQIVIDLSTATPSSTVALDSELRSTGARLIDAGVSGGAAAAERGSLTVMVGCTQADLEPLQWVFAPFTTSVVPMGKVGAGHSVKVLNNFLNAVALSATAEVMVAAKKAGLDLDATLAVLNSSSGVNFATLNRFPHIIHGDYLEGGLTSTLMTKDIALYVDHLRELGVPSLNASGPLASFGLALNTGYADDISNRVVDAIGDVSGGIRLSEPVTETGGQTC